MDYEAIFSHFSPFLKKYWLPLALALFGLIFFIYGLISLLGSASKTQDSAFVRNLPASKPISQITIDIEGAVVTAGVYRLPFGSIIQDALISSHGLSSDADRDYVAKSINLAAKLTDGEKIYIPKVGDNSQNVVGVSTSSNNALSQSGLINVNTATSDMLDSLPGVGLVTAQKIINSRPYSAINDLLDKKIVSSKVFNQIKDKISVY